MADHMTYPDYQALLSGPLEPYYRGRWVYYKEVLTLLQGLSLSTILEIGPGGRPLVKSADLILDPQDKQFGTPAPSTGRTIVHDVTRKPWPIADNAYDMVIALQVWEHLDNKQTRAFRELRRIAKRAILSFPHRWEGGKAKFMHRLHRDIDRELIRDWTLNTPPTKEIEIPRAGPEFSKGPRLIWYWDWTSAPADP